MLRRYALDGMMWRGLCTIGRSTCASDVPTTTQMHRENQHNGVSQRSTSRNKRGFAGQKTPYARPRHRCQPPALSLRKMVHRHWESEKLLQLCPRTNAANAVHVWFAVVHARNSTVHFLNLDVRQRACHSHNINASPPTITATTLEN